MSLVHKWRMPVCVRNWQVEVRVYDKASELKAVIRRLGAKSEDALSACVFPRKIHGHQLVIAHMLFALDAATLEQFMHELGHLTVFIYKSIGRALDASFGVSPEGSADEEIFCDILAQVTVVFSAYWKKHVRST